MRIKNADKKTSVEETTDAPMEFRNRKRFGRKCDPDGNELHRVALAAIRALHFALNLPSRVPLPRSFNKESHDRYREQFWQHVVSYYSRDWANHDGRFFRALADAMEVHLRPNDLVWTSVGDEIIVHRLARMQLPTVAEMYADLCRKGIKTTRKTVERIYKHFGEERKAKRGPRPGTKQKSVHRAH